MQHHTNKMGRLGSLTLPALDQASRAFSSKTQKNARHHIALILFLMLRGCDVRFLLLQDPLWEAVADFFDLDTAPTLQNPKGPIALVCSAMELNWDTISEMEKVVSSLFDKGNS